MKIGIFMKTRLVAHAETSAIKPFQCDFNIKKSKIKISGVYLK